MAYTVPAYNAVNFDFPSVPTISWDTALPDPYSAQNLVVWHFESESGGTLVDDSPSGTNVGGLLGSATLSSTQFRSGTKSAFFTTTSSWIGAGLGQESVVAFGTGDFTFEISVYPLGASVSRVIAANRTDSENGWRIYTTAIGEVIYENNGSLGLVQLRSGTSTIVDGRWCDIIVQRFNGVTYLWCDGYLVDVASDAGNMVSNRVLILGWQHTGGPITSWYGYMDKMRTGKFARYRVNNYNANNFDLAFDASGAGGPIPDEASDNARLRNASILLAI